MGTFLPHTPAPESMHTREPTLTYSFCLSPHSRSNLSSCSSPTREPASIAANPEADKAANEAEREAAKSAKAAEEEAAKAAAEEEAIASGERTAAPIEVD